MKHWSEICTLSLVHFMAFPELQKGEGNFLSTIHQLAQRGFYGALELGMINDASERAAVAQAVQEYGFHVGFGAQPIILGQNLNLNDLDPHLRETAVKTLGCYIDMAAELGAESFVILSGKDPGDELRQQAYQACSDAIIALGKYAEQYGMRIVLETFDREVDKKALVGPSDEAAGFADKIKQDYPRFGLLYDMGHMPLLEEQPYPALSLLHDHLAEVHLGNCVKTPGSPVFGDKHPRFGYSGGVNDTQELLIFIKALFESGYLDDNSPNGELPWLGFEVRPHQGETSQQILDNIQTTWTDAWAQL